MKMFFSMFAAIICAAAVIFGFISVQASHAKEKASHMELLNTSAKLSKHFEESAFSGEKTVDVIHDSMPESLESLTTILKNTRLTKDEMHSVARDIYDYNEEYLNFVKAKYPKETEWAQKMSNALEHFKAVTQ